MAEANQDSAGGDASCNFLRNLSRDYVDKIQTFSFVRLCLKRASVVFQAARNVRGQI